MTTETLPAVAPVEPTTPIKPSEAIRLGCLLAPVQTFGGYGQAYMACAFGAMVAGYSGYSDLSYDPKFSQPVRTFEYLVEDRKFPCPDPDCTDSAVANMVFHLNDDHLWSRERIADWLAEQGL